MDIDSFNRFTRNRDQMFSGDGYEVRMQTDSTDNQVMLFIMDPDGDVCRVDVYCESNFKKAKKKAERLAERICGR